MRLLLEAFLGLQWAACPAPDWLEGVQRQLVSGLGTRQQRVWTPCSLSWLHLLNTTLASFQGRIGSAAHKERASGSLSATAAHMLHIRDARWLQ